MKPQLHLAFLVSFAVSLFVHITPVVALHESDVGVVDWHKHLVGVPLITSPSTVPSFHSTPEGESVILTATGSNVLAALKTTDGSVLWRYIFDQEDGILGYYKSPKTVATLSGLGGSTLRLFNVTTGSIIIEKQLHHPSQGSFSDPPHFGKQVVFSEDAETLYVLSNGYTITAMNASTGDVVWKWTSPDQGSLVLYNKLALTKDTLYTFGFGASIASYTLHVTSLSLQTGELHQSLPIPDARITDPLSGFSVLVRGDIQRPIPVWIENGILRYVVLTRDIKEKTRPVKGTGYERIVDIGHNDGGGGDTGVGARCVVQREDGSAFVLSFEGDVNSVKSLGEIGGTVNSDDVADSLYAGSMDSQGGQFVTRVYWSHQEEVAYSHVFGSNTEVTKAQDFTFKFDTKTHGVIAHVALSPISPTSLHPNLLLTSSTGSIQLWAHNHLQWTREESLASSSIAEFVELPPGIAAAELLAEESRQSYFGRLMRHVNDARGLPRYLVSFVKRFATGDYATTTSSTATSSSPSPAAAAGEEDPSSTPTQTQKQPLSRDTFGFRQIIIVATHYGKIFGLDSSTGEVVWSRLLGLGWAGQLGGRIVPVKVFVVRGVGDVGLDVGDMGGEGMGGGEEGVKGEEGAGVKGGDPEVVLVAQRRADNSLVDTVAFHINAVTGADATGLSKDESVLEGHDVIAGPLVEAYLLNTEQGKVVVLLDEFLQVFTYPETHQTHTLLKSHSRNLSFPLKTSIEGRSRIMGHQIGFPPLEQENQRGVAYPTWSLTLAPKEHVVSITPQSNKGLVASLGKGQVASLGKVLGDRRTLYKYLNGRLVGVQTRSEDGKRCGIWVVDVAKGTVVYRVEVGGRGVGVDVGVVGTPAWDEELEGEGEGEGEGAGAGAGEGVKKERNARKGGRRRCDVKMSLVENWLVYHYYDDGESEGAGGGAKGYRMVSVEFYEGEEDVKMRTSDMSAYSNDTLSLKTFEESFVFPYGVTALGVTSTKYGITSRNLIVATNNHRVQSFPRMFLDPRRPHRKPTSEEMEEQLMQYDPLVPDDQRRIMSHVYDVANINQILTSPSLLESTSLVLAYGLDMFLTRTAPSNTFDVLSENFNKAQLVLTVSGLAVAILVTGPMVRRKKLRERWYQ